MRCHKVTPQAIRCNPFLGSAQTSFGDFSTSKQLKMTIQEVLSTIEDALQSGRRDSELTLVVVEIQEVQVIVQMISEVEPASSDFFTASFFVTNVFVQDSNRFS